MSPTQFTVAALFVVLSILQVGATYKILVVAPTPARSHYNLCRAIADILHETGHEITFVSSFDPDKPRYREISVPELMKFKSVDFNMNKVSKVETIRILNTWIPQMTEALFKSPKMTNMLSNPQEKFDLVIMEFFMNDAILGLGVKYNCPVIPISPVSMLSWLAALTGNPLAPATVPNVFTPFTSHMSLMQRTANTMAHVFQQFMGWWMMTPRQEELYKTILPEEAAKVPLKELYKKISVVLINSHPAVGAVRPLLPNAVEIGGYHIQKVPPLPKDLQTLMDEAKNGVVLFSMGGNLKSSMMPDHLKRDILAALGSVKQLVLWKFEEDLPDKPSNVIIRSWLPQVSVLAHPNTKLFISHGGFVSCTETAYFGVPLLAIPIYGDQHHNTATIVEKGYGLKVDFDTLTKDSLLKPLKEMLENPKYEQNAKRVKSLFHDRPVSPRDLVAFYAEHSIRTNGAKHLSQPDLCLAQTLLLDVVLLLSLPVLLALAIAAFTVKTCWTCLCSKKDGKEKKQKKN